MSVETYWFLAMVTLVLIFGRLCELVGLGKRRTEAAERIAPAVGDISRRMPERMPESERNAALKAVIAQLERDQAALQRKNAEFESLFRAGNKLIMPEKPGEAPPVTGEK